MPLRTRDVYLGIRPTFEGRYAREGAATEFDLVAVGRALLSDAAWAAKVRDGRASELAPFSPEALKELA